MYVIGGSDSVGVVLGQLCNYRNPLHGVLDQLPDYYILTMHFRLPIRHIVSSCTSDDVNSSVIVRVPAMNCNLGYGKC